MTLHPPTTKQTREMERLRGVDLRRRGIPEEEQYEEEPEDYEARRRWERGVGRGNEGGALFYGGGFESSSGSSSASSASGSSSASVGTAKDGGSGSVNGGDDSVLTLLGDVGTMGPEVKEGKELKEVSSKPRSRSRSKESGEKKAVEKPPDEDKKPPSRPTEDGKLSPPRPASRALPPTRFASGSSAWLRGRPVVPRAGSSPPPGSRETPFANSTSRNNTQQHPPRTQHQSGTTSSSHRSRPQNNRPGTPSRSGPAGTGAISSTLRIREELLPELVVLIESAELETADRSSPPEEERKTSVAAEEEEEGRTRVGLAEVEEGGQQEGSPPRAEPGTASVVAEADLRGMPENDLSEEDGKREDGDRKLDEKEGSDVTAIGEIVDLPSSCKGIVEESSGRSSETNELAARTTTSDPDEEIVFRAPDVSGCGEIEEDVSGKRGASSSDKRRRGSESDEIAALLGQGIVTESRGGGRRRGSAGIGIGGTASAQRLRGTPAGPDTGNLRSQPSLSQQQGLRPQPVRIFGPQPVRVFGDRRSAGRSAGRSAANSRVPDGRVGSSGPMSELDIIAQFL